MKIAILSDLHSNLEALTACRERALECGAQRFICLGDCIGYGPDPVGTLDLLMSLPGIVTVLGNHDEYHILDGIERNLSPTIRQATEWTRAQLKPRHLDYLRSLPYVHVERGVTYVHASAAAPQEWEYLFEPDQVMKCLRAADTGLVFIGHVHIPGLFHQLGDDRVEALSTSAGKPLPLLVHHRYMVNVGSVGQPRDDNSAASFVIYDEEKYSVVFHRVAYDFAATGAKILAAGLNPFFAERLADGR